MIGFLERILDADNSGLHLSNVLMSGQPSECVFSCVQQSRQRMGFKEALCLIYYSSLKSALLLMVLMTVRLCSELCYIQYGRTCDGSGHHHILMVIAVHDK